MYSTRTRLHTRIPNGHPRKEKGACRAKVRGQVGDFRARRTRRLPCEDPRAEVGE